MGHSDLLLLIHVLKVQNALAIWGNVPTPVLAKSQMKRSITLCTLSMELELWRRVNCTPIAIPIGPH